MKIRLYTLVWGREYTELFLKYSLPSHGLDQVDFAGFDVKYRIYTDQQDLIRQHPAFEPIKAFTEFRPLTTDTNIQDQPGVVQDIMHQYYKSFLKEAYDEDAYFRSITPDIIVSPGAMATALKRIREGYRAVVIPTGAMRVEPDLIKDPSMPGVFFSAMHKETRDHFIDSPNFHPQPAMYLTKTDYGAEVKSYLCQPFIIRQQYSRKFRHAEYDFISTAVPDMKEIYIVPDSREMFEVSITKPYLPHHLWGPGTFSFDRMQEWMKGKINPHMKTFFDRGYKIYA